MGDRDWMRLHVETVFNLDATGRMARVKPDGSAAPRFFLGRTTEGNDWWFRSDLDGELVEALGALCLEEPMGQPISREPRGLDQFERLLSEHSPIKKRWAGPAYRFPEDVATSVETVLVTEENSDLLIPYFEDWLGDVQNCQPFAALLQDGRAVSLCATVRTSSRADEAGADTRPEFRGQGFAGHVVAAWARAVGRLGRIPLYSTSWENEASQAVARKLGLIQFGTDLHVT